MKNLTNLEISQQFQTQLESGKLFSYHVTDLKTDKNGKEFVSLFVAKGELIKNDFQTVLATGKENRVVMRRNILGYVLINECSSIIKPMLEVGGTATIKEIIIQELISTKQSWSTQEPRIKTNGDMLYYNDVPCYSTNQLAQEGEDLVIYSKEITDENLLEFKNTLSFLELTK